MSKAGTFVAVVLVLTGSICYAQQPRIDRVYKNGTTFVKMAPLKVSGEKDEYYSLHFGLSYKYEGGKPKPPDYIEFEIETVVKRRRLNPDLYIEFLIDGERVFLSSKRRAVKNPVPGRRMIGERIAMRMPLETYLKLARADSTLIRMGSSSFVIGSEQKGAMLKLLQTPAS